MIKHTIQKMIRRNSHSHQQAPQAPPAAHLAHVREKLDWNNLYVHDVMLHKPKAIWASTSLTLQQTLDLMTFNQVLAFPVKTNSEVFCGFISLVDILELWIEQGGAPSSLQTTVGDALEAKKVRSLTSHRVWDMEGKEDDQFIEILQHLSMGVHRVLVTFGDGGQKVLTQTDACRYILYHVSELGHDIENRTVDELGLVSSEPRVFTVAKEMVAREAYKQMFSANHEAVAVVDGSNHLVANLSISDIRGLSAADYLLLDNPVEVFLKKRHPAGHPISVKRTAKLAEVLKTLVEGRIHRVYIVDDDNVLIDVVSMSDVLSKFSPIDPKDPSQYA